MCEEDLALSLIARWSWNNDNDQLPNSVVWSDGSPSTASDFKKHRKDTAIQLLSPHREMRFYPRIRAEVKFNSRLNAWTATGAGVTPIILRLKDQQATDARILRELTFSVVPVAVGKVIYFLQGSRHSAHFPPPMEGLRWLTRFSP
jgi:hypothetical protein